MTGSMRHKREVIPMQGQAYDDSIEQPGKLPFHKAIDGYNIEFNDEEIEATVAPQRPGKKMQDFDFHLPHKDFEVVGKLQIQQHKFPMPEVPTGFDINKIKVAPGSVLPYQPAVARLNPDKRSTLLGEAPPPVAPVAPPKAAAAVAPQRPTFVLKPKIFVQDLDEFSEADIVIELPFAKDRPKMERFKAYAAEKKGLKVSGITSNNVSHTT